METQFSLPLISAHSSKSLAITEILINLDKLTKIKSEIISNINSKTVSRINRLQKIKSRLIRLKSIINIVSNQQKVITMKSAVNYPKSLKEIMNNYLSEGIDINIIRNKITKLDDKINTKNVYADGEDTSIENKSNNTKNINNPTGTIDDAIIMQKILNEQINKYNDISYKIFNNNFLQDNEFEIDKGSIYTMDNFSFFDKSKINEKKNLDGDFVKLVETPTMRAFSLKMKDREKNKKLQQAPVSIRKSQKLGEYKNKAFYGLNKNENQIELDLPENVDLKNVAEIERFSEAKENDISDNNSEEVQIKNEIDDIFNKDDTNEPIEEDEPIDWMKEKRMRNEINKNIQKDKEYEEDKNTENEKTENKEKDTNTVDKKKEKNDVYIHTDSDSYSPPPSSSSEDEKEKNKNNSNKNVNENINENNSPTEKVEENTQIKEETENNTTEINKTENIPKKPEGPRPLSMEEQILLARNKIKKAKEETEKKEEKKEEPKNDICLMSILQKQIQNRFANLHNDSEEDVIEDEEEDD